MTIRTCLFFLFAAGLTACHHSDMPAPQSRPYSTWIVNGQDSITTNHVDTMVECSNHGFPCNTYLYSTDSVRWFSLAFGTDVLPASGRYRITAFPGYSFVTASLKTYYNGRHYQYESDAADSVFISTAEGHVRYTIPHAQLVSVDAAVRDTIQVQAILVRP